MCNCLPLCKRLPMNCTTATAGVSQLLTSLLVYLLHELKLPLAYQSNWILEHILYKFERFTQKKAEKAIDANYFECIIDFVTISTLD